MTHQSPLCPVYGTDEVLIGCPCNDEDVVGLVTFTDEEMAAMPKLGGRLYLTSVGILQRIRAGWLPHRVGGVDGRWWWGRPRYDDGFKLWSQGYVPSMSFVEEMSDDEITAWVESLHPMAGEREADDTLCGEQALGCGPCQLEKGHEPAERHLCGHYAASGIELHSYSVNPVSKRSPIITIELHLWPQVPNEAEPYWWGNHRLSFRLHGHGKPVWEADIPEAGSSTGRSARVERRHGFGWVLVLTLTHDRAKQVLDRLALPHHIDRPDALNGSSWGTWGDDQ